MTTNQQTEELIDQLVVQMQAPIQTPCPVAHALDEIRTAANVIENSKPELDSAIQAKAWAIKGAGRFMQMAIALQKEEERFYAEA